MNESRTADIIVIGGGVFGCSTAYSLAKNGARSVVLLERKEICSGGTDRSCGIVRTHYSVIANMEHAVESLKIYENFGETVGGDAGFHRTGYLILGPAEHREPMEAVFREQNKRGIDTATLTREEARRVHPLLELEDADVIGYDTLTGYCDPNLTTTSYAKRARELGVKVYTDTPVTGVELRGDMKAVQTPSGKFECAALIIAAGPWTQSIGEMIGVEFPYVTSRHKVITLKLSQPYQANWPMVKDLTIPDKIYIRPEAGGLVLAGTGDHGEPIDDPDTADTEVDTDHVVRMGRLISRLMPAMVDAQYVAGWTGPYDITPDWNPLVGAVPGLDGVYVAAGFSGHGFKLAPTIGESLAQTVLGLKARVPIDIYSMARFDGGRSLQGAYGIGSIS